MKQSLMMVATAGSVALASSSTCDVSQCTVTVYGNCAFTPSSECDWDWSVGPVGPDCLAHCGDGCEYLADGIGDSGCAWDPCESGTAATGGWQNIGHRDDCPSGGGAGGDGVIDAIDVTGGCQFQLARGENGADPFSKIFEPGFHGVWNTYDVGYDNSDGNHYHFGDNVLSIKMWCSSEGTLTWHGWGGRNLNECEGDCDNDGHCAAGLECYHNAGVTKNGPPPGCTGTAFTENADYCYDPNYELGVAAAAGFASGHSEDEPAEDMEPDHAASGDLIMMMVGAAIGVMVVAGIAVLVISIKRKRSGKKEETEMAKAVHVPETSPASVDGVETI